MALELSGNDWEIETNEMETDASTFPVADVKPAKGEEDASKTTGTDAAEKEVAKDEWAEIQKTDVEANEEKPVEAKTKRKRGYKILEFVRNFGLTFTQKKKKAASVEKEDPDAVEESKEKSKVSEEDTKEAEAKALIRNK